MANTDKYDLGTSDYFKQQMEVAGLMLRGAAFGAALFFGIGIFFWVLWLIGSVLPPESKQAPDPTPWSYMAPAEDGTRAA